jgi:hypothetical protein
MSEARNRFRDMLVEPQQQIVNHIGVRVFLNGDRCGCVWAVGDARAILEASGLYNLPDFVCDLHELRSLRRSDLE